MNAQSASPSMPRTISTLLRVRPAALIALGAMYLAGAAGARGADEGTASPATSEVHQTASSTKSKVGDPLPIGMNLAAMSAMNRELVFVDVMKMATRWFDTEEAEASGGRPRRQRGGAQGRRAQGGREGQGEAARPEREPYTEVPIDEHGWPLPAAGKGATAFMLRDMDGHYPGGTYTCTWEGTADISFSGAARVAARGDHRLEVKVTPSRDQVALTVRNVDPEDPVRNIRFLMPGFEDAKSPFHPRFLERLRPFSVIRFWPWSKANLASGKWEARATFDSAIQTGKEGVAVEYMVDLCNELGARPWFCMPHLADDDYVRRFATIVKERLRPELSMYVEYSNEVWNSDFPQAQWALKQSRAEGIRTPEITAREAMRDWRIWHEVFGDEKARVIRVAAGHLHNPTVLKVMTDALGDEVDALSVATYFGLKAKEEGFNAKTTAAEILAAARKNLEGVVMTRIQQHKTLADRVGERVGRHIPLIAYEGGQHIIARQSLRPGDMRMALSLEAAAAAQDLEGMYDAYRDLIEKGQEAGLELFVAYYFVGPRNHSDSFAHLQYLDQPISEAPKFRALVRDWIKK